MPAEAQSPRLADSCGAFLQLQLQQSTVPRWACHPSCMGHVRVLKRQIDFDRPRGPLSLLQPISPSLSLVFYCSQCLFLALCMCRQETDSLKLQAASRVPVVASHVAHCCLDGLHVDRLWFFFVFLFLLPFCSATDCLRRRRCRRLGNWSCYVNCCG